MRQGRLSDAAIALYRTLSQHNVKFGIFGVTKEQILGILDHKAGFEAVPQSRTDYVAFLWSEKPNRERAVLVEIFCEGFPGALFTMAEVSPTVTQVSGETQGIGSTALLDPVYIFKGKLRAAATRDKYHDSADLRWLEGNSLIRLQQNKSKFSPLYVGLALKRYPELRPVFTRIGIDIEGAEAAAASYQSPQLPQPGDVQKGLLAPTSAI